MRSERTENASKTKVEMRVRDETCATDLSKLKKMIDQTTSGHSN